MSESKSESTSNKAGGEPSKNRKPLEVKRVNRGELLGKIRQKQSKSSVPAFKPGDTVRVHSRIIEGNKERIQVFEGVVIRRHKRNQSDATFTVRKISYNVGVERIFLLHSPRVEKVEVVSKGEVRRARLYYLRGLRGKAARIRSQVAGEADQQTIDLYDESSSENTSATATSENGSGEGENGAVEPHEARASA